MHSSDLAIHVAGYRRLRQLFYSENSTENQLDCCLWAALLSRLNFTFQVVIFQGIFFLSFFFSPSIFCNLYVELTFHFPAAARGYSGIAGRADSFS